MYLDNQYHCVEVQLGSFLFRIESGGNGSDIGLDWVNDDGKWKWTTRRGQHNYLLEQ